MSERITRRAALIGAMASSALLAPPVAASLAEAPHERVFRLADELSAALRDWDSFKRVVVTDTHASWQDYGMAFDLQTWLDRAPKMDVAEYHHTQLGIALNRINPSRWRGKIDVEADMAWWTGSVPSEGRPAGVWVEATGGRRHV